MSDSWIAWKPRIEEPSKLSPSSKTAWSKDDTGTVKCCMMPGRTQNRTSIISTPSSLTYLSSSSLLLNIRPPWHTDSGREPSSRQPKQSGVGLPGPRCSGGCPHRRQGQFPDRIRFGSPMEQVFGGARDPAPGTLGPVSTQGPTVQFETASWARRILALFVDWFASTLVVILVLG